MKVRCNGVLAAVLCAAAPVLALGEVENPLGQVLNLIDQLEAKIIKEGEAEAKAYAEYVEWCDDASSNTQFAIKTATSDKEKLEANINELAGEIKAADSNIEQLAASIATSETELKDATVIREKEEADFKANQQELVESIDMLDRAINVLEKEMAKNPALAQISLTSSGALSALSQVLDATSFSTADQTRLQAMLQAQTTDSSSSELDDLELGAPAAAVYKSKSGNIVETLEDMKEKAEGQLSDLRKAETNNRHNYKMLAQSLKDQKAGDTKDMNRAKTNKAAAEEAKATAEGDLETTNKDLGASKQALATAHSGCMTTAADHETTVNARTEELKVINEARQILKDTSSGAVGQSYSLLQVQSSMRTHADLVKSEVIAMIRNLAKQEHSNALAQLASRVATESKFGSSHGQDQFSKIKGLISDMISKLESEADSEATEKAYCDEQIAKTEEKKSELNDDAAKMTAQIDQATARSAELKEQVKELQTELSALAREQAEMDKIRQETHADFVQAKKDLDLGLSGVRKALGVLREYYQSGSALLQDNLAASMRQPAAPEHHSKASGAGTSIIGILEVVESDFATNLAKEEAQEDDAESEYEKTSQENKVTKTTKDQDVKYKSQESKSLDKTISEISSDLETTNSELSAVLEYYAKIKERCIAKPETYEERKARRTAEINGLKQALTVLEDETAFVQRKSRGHHIRGSAMQPY